jgi:hypothetical protein
MEESRQKLRQLSCLFDNISEDQQQTNPYVEQMNIINKCIEDSLGNKDVALIFYLPDKMLNSIEDELIINGWNLDVPRFCRQKCKYQYMMVKK